MALPTKEAVETFLASMGTTADEVADWLRSHEITGNHNPRGCPIAKAIRRHFELTNDVPLYVFGNGTVEYGNYSSGGYQRAILPPPVREFVQRFDAEIAYADLYAS